MSEVPLYRGRFLMSEVSLFHGRFLMSEVPLYTFHREGGSTFKHGLCPGEAKTPHPNADSGYERGTPVLMSEAPLYL